ncbi:MAG: YvcK family protein, partial [Microcystis sp. LE19-196.1B]|nr:YvcK family protein [Microcystis sp. LE19-196.1B]
MSPFKQTLRELNAQKGKIAASVGRKTPKRVNRWFKWLSPGLFVKRWLLISLTGVFLTSFGLAIWVKLTPVNRFLEFVSQALEMIARLVPNSVSGPLAVLLGVFLLFWGQSRTVETITEALQPDASEELVDLLRTHRRLHRGPKIVAIGGGTGLSTLLRGLKQYSSNITAIVTVADDGGSSGRLRREMGILPPGDIRNCIAALADEEKLLTELFQYRFHAGDGLSGHSFGNLFISAMTEITGDLEQAIDASAKVLAIRGKVLPATLTDVSLWAKLADGRIIEGESKITEAMGQIRQIGCHPADPVALPAALAAIKEADYIIIGPGSLYTSIIPNLLVPAIRQALAQVTVPRVYVCNIMTQPGETDNYSVADHLRAIEGVCEERIIDAVLA